MSTEAAKSGFQTEALPWLPAIGNLFSRARGTSQILGHYLGTATDNMHTISDLLLEGPLVLHRRNTSDSNQLNLPHLDKRGFLQLLETPDTDTRTAFVLSGGGMAGIKTAAALEPFYEQSTDGSRLTDNLGAVAGVSVGAINGVYLLDAIAKTEQLDAVEIYKSFATRNFISKRKLLPKSLNIDYLRNRIANDTIPERIRDEVPIDFYVGVTRASDGGRELLDTRTMSGTEIIDAVIASSSASYVTEGLSVINGQLVGDGNLTGVPVQEMVDHGFNNIGVFTNYSLEEDTHYGVDRTVVDTYLAGTHYPNELRKATYDHDALTRQSLEALNDPRILSAAIFAPEYREKYVHILSTEPDTLEIAGHEARARLVYDINTHLPHRVQTSASV